MLVNLTDVFTSEGLTEERCVEIDFDEFSTGQEVYPVVSKEPVRLTLENIGHSKARIRGEASVKPRHVQRIT